MFRKYRWLMLSACCFVLSLSIAVVNVVSPMFSTGKFSEVFTLGFLYDVVQVILYKGLGFYCMFEYEMETIDDCEELSDS